MKPFSVNLDWIAGTLPLDGDGYETALKLINELSVISDWFLPDRWQMKTNGLNYYKSVLCWGGSTAMHIAWNDERPEMKLYFQMSGKVLDKFGFAETDIIIKYLQENNFMCTRFDMALDIFDPFSAPINEILESFREYAHLGRKVVVSRIHRENFKTMTSGYFDGRPYYNWVVGSRKGHFYFRFYDKKVEQKLRLSEIDEKIKNGEYKGQEAEYMRKIATYWYRVECEVKHFEAAEIFNKLGDSKQYGSIMSQLMNESFKFIERCDDDKNANKKESVNWWKTFVEKLASQNFVELVRSKIMKAVSIIKTMKWYQDCLPRIVCLKIIAMQNLKYLDDEEQDILFSAWNKPKHKTFLITHGIYLDYDTDEYGVIKYKLRVADRSYLNDYNFTEEMKNESYNRGISESGIYGQDNRRNDFVYGASLLYN